MSTYLHKTRKLGRAETGEKQYKRKIRTNEQQPLHHTTDLPIFRDNIYVTYPFSQALHTCLRRVMWLGGETSGSRGTHNVPLSQVLTEGPHSPDSLPTENTLGSNNTRHPLWEVSNYTDKTQRQGLKV